MTTPNPVLVGLRKRIDRVDDQIVKLLKRRLRYVQQVGELKAQNGDQVYDPRREREIIARLCGKKPGALTSRELKTIYLRILRVSRDHQRRVFQENR
jgi:chorismate mutase/prephenate dehydratase